MANKNRRDQVDNAPLPYAEGKTADGLSFLTADILGDLDKGFARQAINAALCAAAHDTEIRGFDDGKARKVIITISLTKVTEDNVRVDVNAEAKIPSFKMAGTMGQARPVGGGKYNFAFRPENTERHDQPTLEFEPDTEAESDE